MNVTRRCPRSGLGAGCAEGHPPGGLQRHRMVYAYRWLPCCTRDSDAHELIRGAAPPPGIGTSTGGPAAAIIDALVVRPRSSWVECSRSSWRTMTSSARTACERPHGRHAHAGGPGQVSAGAEVAESPSRRRRVGGRGGGVSATPRSWQHVDKNPFPPCPSLSFCAAARSGPIRTAGLDRRAVGQSTVGGSNGVAGEHADGKYMLNVPQSRGRCHDPASAGSTSASPSRRRPSSPTMRVKRRNQPLHF